MRWHLAGQKFWLAGVSTFASAMLMQENHAPMAVDRRQRIIRRVLKSQQNLKPILHNLVNRLVCLQCVFHGIVVDRLDAISRRQKPQTLTPITAMKALFSRSIARSTINPPGDAHQNNTRNPAKSIFCIVKVSGSSLGRNDLHQR